MLAPKRTECDGEAARGGEPSTSGALAFVLGAAQEFRGVDFLLQIIHIIISIFVCMIHLTI